LQSQKKQEKTQKWLKFALVRLKPTLLKLKLALERPKLMQERKPQTVAAGGMGILN
jgi:hypothetical protein